MNLEAKWLSEKKINFTPWVVTEVPTNWAEVIFRVDSTLIMTSTKVVETLVHTTTKIHSPDYPHSDDRLKDQKLIDLIKKSATSLIWAFI